MSSAMYEQMRSNPKFQKLVATRGRFAWTLSIVVLVLFVVFVLAVAYAPSTLGRPVSDGAMLTVGVAAELFLFILFWGLSAIYVRRANGEFDTLTQEIIKQAQKESR